MTPEQQAAWSHTGYVKASQYRTAAVTELAARDATPTTLEDATPYSITHLSRALSELRERGLVTLQVPEDQQKGRVYGLTERGETVAELLTERDDP